MGNYLVQLLDEFKRHSLNDINRGWSPATIICPRPDEIQVNR